MSLKKNGFSFLLWFLYAALVIAAFLGLGAFLTDKNGYAAIFGWGGALILLMISGILVALFHKLTRNTSGKNNAAKRQNATQSRKIAFLVLEAVIVVVLLAVAFVWDIHMMSMAGERAAYYEYSMVADGKSVPTVVHGAQYVYLQVLHGLFFLLGNKFIAAVWFQIVLHLLVALIFYFCVRKACGVFSALITLGFAALGPFMRSEAVQLSPVLLFLVIFGVVLLILIGCIGQKNPLTCLIGGLFIVAVSYLDVAGLVLIPFLVWGLLTDEEGNPTVARRIGCMLTGFFGILLGTVVLFGIDALGSHKKVLDVFMAWWKLYHPQSFSVPYLVDEGNIPLETVVLILLLGFGVFSFWCRRKQENLTLWVVCLFAMLALLCGGMTTKEMDDSILLYLIMTVLAGVGIGGSIQKETAPQNRSIISASNQEESSEIEGAFTDEEHSSAESEDSDYEPGYTPKKQVVFLENPLPLPKKHVKKVLDYDRTPEISTEEEDDFDISVSDEDDFDL